MMAIGIGIGVANMYIEAIEISTLSAEERILMQQYEDERQELKLAESRIRQVEVHKDQENMLIGIHDFFGMYGLMLIVIVPFIVGRTTRFGRNLI